MTDLKKVQIWAKLTWKTLLFCRLPFDSRKNPNKPRFYKKKPLQLWLQLQSGIEQFSNLRAPVLKSLKWFSLRLSRWNFIHLDLNDTLFSTQWFPNSLETLGITEVCVSHEYWQPRGWCDFSKIVSNSNSAKITFALPKLYFSKNFYTNKLMCMTSNSRDIKKFRNIIFRLEKLCHFGHFCPL